MLMIVEPGRGAGGRFDDPEHGKHIGLEGGLELLIGQLKKVLLPYLFASHVHNCFEAPIFGSDAVIGVRLAGTALA